MRLLYFNLELENLLFLEESVRYRKFGGDVTCATSILYFSSYNQRKENTRTKELRMGLNVRRIVMISDGCQGKSRNISIQEKICPQCGSIIELFSIDTQVACETCGFIAYNDKLSCVQWCKQARKCVGDEMYEYMMKVAEMQKKIKRCDIREETA